MLLNPGSETSPPSRIPGIGSAWRWAVAAGVTALTVAVVAKAAPPSAIANAIRLSIHEPLVILLAIGAYAAAFVLRARAWRMLQTGPLPLRTLVANLHVSLFLNHVLPLKAGEVSRPLLAARHGEDPADAVASTIAARTLDFVALAVIALVLLPATWDGGRVGTAGLFAAAATLAGTCTLVALRNTTLPVPGPAIFQDIAGRLRLSLRAIDGTRIALAFPLVLISWLLESAVLLSAAHLLGIEISFQLAAGATAFTILFQAFHFTPGGIGVYETAMTAALTSQSIPANEALALAALTHGMKFAYAFTAGAAFASSEGISLLRGRRGSPARTASRFEVVMARLWNAVNEGKPFTPIFTLAVIAVVSVPHARDALYWKDAAFAIAAIVPLAVVFYRFAFPLRLRAALWVYLAVFAMVSRTLPLGTVGAVLVLYFGFTVVLWGTIYYHLRIGTPWTNGFRFVRLVVENPDPTSGNFLEQVPKVLLLLFLFDFALSHPADEAAAGALLLLAVVAVSALLLHQWFFTWVPGLPQPKLAAGLPAPLPGRRATRVIAIVIDGCRADRLAEARTPAIDALRASGTEFTAMSTVYPARTVTCFSSMLTGAPPNVHGMHSNFVPDLGIKCESVFDVLREAGMHGRMVGIAHLIDAFGARDVATVTAVMHNDEIDGALVEQAQRILREEDPDLLVLQLLSVDQTGHARGSYNAEYLAKIEETDRTIDSFLAWCKDHGFLDGATVLVTADHGQSIGIGGHGHMSPPEIRIPCIISGAGVPAGRTTNEPRFVTDIAATITAALGLRAPSASVGRDLLAASPGPLSSRPVAFIIPARNEAARLPAVLAAVNRSGVENREIIVVDDGSSDETAALAKAAGAIVVSHERSLGLGAAVRTGLMAARSLSPRATVYLDGDGEYDARETRGLLAPIERGEADYVLGSRFLGGAPRGMPRSRRAANRAFSLLLSVCCGRRISDGQTGFRAFSPRGLEVAEIVHDYNYAQVLTLDLLRKGMRMVEVPITYRRREGGQSFISGAYLWRVPLGMVREMLAQ